MGERRTGLVRVLNRYFCEKCGIFEVKRRFTLAKVQLLSKLKNPSLNQAQSVAGSLQWVSQMRPWNRPFLAGIYAFFEYRSEFGKQAEIVDCELEIWEIPLKSPRFPTQQNFSGK